MCKCLEKRQLSIFRTMQATDATKTIQMEKAELQLERTHFKNRPIRVAKAWRSKLRPPGLDGY
jgi:hypothetical protein